MRYCQSFDLDCETASARVSTLFRHEGEVGGAYRERHPALDSRDLRSNIENFSL